VQGPFVTAHNKSSARAGKEAAACLAGVPGIALDGGLVSPGQLGPVQRRFFCARPKLPTCEVVFRRPVVVPVLADFGLLANALRHGCHRCWSAVSPPVPELCRSCECNHRPGGCGGFCEPHPCLFFARAHPTSAPVSRSSQPPCDTRHEEAPAAYVCRGFGFLHHHKLPHQVLVMSTSFVSGRKRKPTTRLISATPIGYQRPE
jgi:hypothetical protein